MRSIKSKITQLKKRVLEILPEDKDLLGFEGISKEIIIQCLNESYETLELLTDYSDKLEGVLLQRKLDRTLNSANQYLKEKFKHLDEKDFNDFLYSIGDMHYNIKETYILFTKDPIRLDISVTKAKEMLTLLENQNIEIQPLLETLTSLYKSTQETATSLLDQTKDAAGKLTGINNLLTNIQGQKKKADIATQSILKNEEKMQAISMESVNMQIQTSALYDQLQKLYDILKTDRVTFDTSLNDLQASIVKNAEHQQEIQKTIGNANRAGMAGSFKKRKDELGIPYWAWGAATVLTIIAFIYTSYTILELLKGKTFSYDYLIIRIPILAAFVWLGWFCAKQFGFVSRIREDYSYKYAVSMAFEGYREATLEIDQGMLVNLLILTLQNISTSPLTIFETTTNHGTPVNEILSGWKKKNEKNNTNKSIGSNHEGEDTLEEE